MEELKINLRTLWKSPNHDLPEWVLSTYNCIYRIVNLINNKCYIGQAKCFYGRLVTNPTYLSHLNHFIDYCKHNYNNRYLYNSIRKYGSRNFEVTIIESNLNYDKLNEREIYWIKYYNSFGTNGYNMNSGGHNCEQFYNAAHSPEVVKRSRESDRRNHGGVLAIHLPESRKRALESYRTHGVYEMMKTQRLNHGGVLAFNTKESYLNSVKGHTEEVRRRMVESDKANHGGMMRMHHPDIRELAIRNNYENHGGVFSWHTNRELGVTNMTLTKLFSSINNKISRLSKSDLNYTSYINLIHPKSKQEVHLSRILRMLNKLIIDPRWTPEMSQIFKDYLPKSDNSLIN